MTKPVHPIDQEVADAIATAESFIVSLFLGGLHEAHPFKSFEKAVQAAALLPTARGSSRRAIVYGITADGRSVMIPPKFFPPDTTQKPMETDMSLVEMAKTLAAPQSAVMADAKGTKPPTKSEKAAAAVVVATSKPTDNKAELRKIADAAATVKKPTVVPPAWLVADPKKDGIPVELQVQNRKPLTAAQQKKMDDMAKAKAAKDAEKKAAPAKKAAAAAKPPRKGKNGKTRYDWEAAAENAKKGILPPTPDFSANTHKCYRPHLADAVKAAKDGNIAALKKVPVTRDDGSPKIIGRYRDLCIIAIKAKDAKK